MNAQPRGKETSRLKEDNFFDANIKMSRVVNCFAWVNICVRGGFFLKKGQLFIYSTFEVQF